MLSALEVVLLAAGLVAGVTGAWSPCGFSMVDTLAPHGYAGRLRTTLVGCATFAAGALAGGVATFGALALLGRALGAGGTAAIGVAAAVALAAAAGEARGGRIVPQVRRQVPESWRRVLALPLAAGLYGVLLGLGFTTFILSFAVWALAGVSVALGDPALGLLVGLGFGAGRALPVVLLAPLAGTRRGAGAHAAMAERPRLLRALRAADAVALAACAAALWAAPAQAASVFATPASDPSVDAGLLAYQQPGTGGVLVSPGGGLLAYQELDSIAIRAPADPAYAIGIPAPGADAIAVAAGWVAWRARVADDDVLMASPLPPAPPAVRTVATAAHLGRPALSGDRLLFHVTSDGRSRIDEVALASGHRRTLRSQARALLLNPSAHEGLLLYVRSTSEHQELRLGPLRSRRVRGDRTLYAIVPTGRRDAGHEPGDRHKAHGHPKRPPPRPRRGVAYTLWTTALGPHDAYVTRLRQDAGEPVRATLLRVPR